jgi:hypothetical protein
MRWRLFFIRAGLVLLGLIILFLVVWFFSWIVSPSDPSKRLRALRTEISASQKAADVDARIKILEAKSSVLASASGKNGDLSEKIAVDTELLSLYSERSGLLIGGAKFNRSRAMVEELNAALEICAQSVPCMEKARDRHLKTLEALMEAELPKK